MSYPTGKTRRKILIVDDERLIADTLTAIFQSAGYQTETAYSGEAAIEIASRFLPDLLLSDVKMQGISGIDAAVEIRAVLPDCPVLFISGHVTEEVLDDPKLPPYKFQFCAKPAPPRELLQKVADMLAVKPFPGLTIVNVDDAEIHRYTITRLLEHAGFRVAEAATGADALRLAESLPDLILLDINLPDMSGFEVCRLLKAKPETAQIPIIHLTNTCRDEQSRQLALQLGADDYLTHPVEPEPFIALLRRLAGADTRSGRIRFGYV